MRRAVTVISKMDSKEQELIGRIIFEEDKLEKLEKGPAERPGYNKNSSREGGRPTSSLARDCS